ncbi:MAG: cation-translocating P-type ATPase [Oscillospiraceae bacterium]|nr:cation-translocating P-type ATPase [Oscillospiraceae bacterium]
MAAERRKSAPAPEPLCPAPELGLTAEQAAERLRAGLANLPVRAPGKRVSQIFFTNIFTYFNLVFVILAALVAAVGSWNNLTFMGVVLCNTAIGIIQELRSKRVLDRLKLLNAQRVTAVRDGTELELRSEELVRDDVVVFRAGEQICADAEVLSGSCRVNEALVTGEADEITKQPGDRLLSGSFLVSGLCRARLTAVGAESYAGRLTLEARRSLRSHESEMMHALSQLVKWIGILLFPLGGALLFKELVWRHADWGDAIVQTVAALIGMIPEGLYLLTSLALVASVVRLARRQTLVHELKSIETLARVDVLCVDKTGTITENTMSLDSLLPLNGASEAELRGLLGDYVAAIGGENDTMQALKGSFDGCGAGRVPAELFPFTSAKKFGAVCFTTGESCYLGAPEVLLGARVAELELPLSALAGRGCRVLLLAGSELATEAERAPDPGDLRPLAFIALHNPIRAAAPETFRYFASEGVSVRVISGDNPRTVSQVAKSAGIPGAERWIDARTLTDDAALDRAAADYTVFGRVTPEQKRRLIRALKAQGHTVAMTGDGVNDVLALKEADCSVAMAAGSDAASRVSDLVLLENDFSVMPGVVAEGRRVINNIERSATLFLLKNIFALALALTSLFFALPFPFTPVQMSLIGMLTIGFPAFVLALEPNESLVRGRFLANVLRRAVPPAFTDYLLILAAIALSRRLGIPPPELSTVCVYIMSLVGLAVILRLCIPFTPIRKLLLLTIALGYALAILGLDWWFQLSPLSGNALLLLAAGAALIWPLLLGLTRLWERAVREKQ